MRKSLLGILLAATLLPMSVVHAAGEGTAKAAYKVQKKTVKDSIAAAVAAGASLQQAMNELLADNVDATAVIQGAIEYAPSKAGQIAGFAIAAGVPATTAVSAAVAVAPNSIQSITSNAIAAAPTEANSIVNTANNTTGATNTFSLTTTNTGFTVSVTPVSGNTGGGGGSTVITCDTTKVATCS